MGYHNNERRIRWQRGEMIGQGAFGRVYLSLNLDTGELMAVKHLDTQSVSSRGREALENEVSMMRGLSHPNIVRYIGVDCTDQALAIFLEYVSGGSLRSLLDRFGKLEEAIVRLYTRQICLGLEYLHSKHIAHRDIKAANVLVSNDGSVKLADFGASKRIANLNGQANVNNQVTGGGAKGTPLWMAPEVIKDTPKANQGWRKADVWSVGCTVIEMSTGRPPWSQYSNPVTAMYHIACVEELPEMPETLSMDGHQLLWLCFQRDPKTRPEASQLLLQPFAAVAPTAWRDLSRRNELEQQQQHHSNLNNNSNSMDYYDNANQSTSNMMAANNNYVNNRARSNSGHNESLYPSRPSTTSNTESHSSGRRAAMSLRVVTDTPPLQLRPQQDPSSSVDLGSTKPPKSPSSGRKSVGAAVSRKLTPPQQAVSPSITTRGIAPAEEPSLHRNTSPCSARSVRSTARTIDKQRESDPELLLLKKAPAPPASTMKIQQQKRTRLNKSSDDPMALLGDPPSKLHKLEQPDASSRQQPQQSKSTRPLMKKIPASSSRGPTPKLALQTSSAPSSAVATSRVVPAVQRSSRGPAPAADSKVRKSSEKISKVKSNEQPEITAEPTSGAQRRGSGGTGTAAFMSSPSSSRRPVPVETSRSAVIAAKQLKKKNMGPKPAHKLRANPRLPLGGLMTADDADALSKQQRAARVVNRSARHSTGTAVLERHQRSIFVVTTKNEELDAAATATAREADHYSDEPETPSFSENGDHSQDVVLKEPHNGTLHVAPASEHTEEELSMMRRSPPFEFSAPPPMRARIPLALDGGHGGRQSFGAASATSACSLDVATGKSLRRGLHHDTSAFSPQQQEIASSVPARHDERRSPLDSIFNSPPTPSSVSDNYYSPRSAPTDEDEEEHDLRVFGPPDDVEVAQATARLLPWDLSAEDSDLVEVGTRAQDGDAEHFGEESEEESSEEADEVDYSPTLIRGENQRRGFLRGDAPVVAERAKRRQRRHHEEDDDGASPREEAFDGGEKAPLTSRLCEPTALDVLHQHDAPVTSLAAAGDMLASASMDGTVELFRIETESAPASVATLRHDRIRLLHPTTFPAETSSQFAAVTALAFNGSADRCVTGADDFCLRIWSVDTHSAPIHVLEGHEGRITKIRMIGEDPKGTNSTARATSPNNNKPAQWAGCVVTASTDHTIRLWDVRMRRPQALTLRGHTDTVNDICLDSENITVFSASRDTSIRVWDLRCGRSRFHLTQHFGSVQCLLHDQTLDCDRGGFLSGARDTIVHVWARQSGALIRALRSQRGFVDSLHLLPAALTRQNSTPLLAAGSTNGKLRLWDHHSGRCLRAFAGHTQAITSLAFCPSSSTTRTTTSCTPATNNKAPMPGWLFAGGADGALKAWDVKNGSLVAQLEGHTGAVTGMHLQQLEHQEGNDDSALRHTARLFSASKDGSVRVCAL